MTELTIDQALQQGVAAHRAGKLQEAERLYRAIIGVRPQHPDANHNLGVIRSQRGRGEEAIRLFQKAVQSNSNSLQFWLSLLNALMKSGDLKATKDQLRVAKNKAFPENAFGELEKKIKEREAFEAEIEALINKHDKADFAAVVAEGKKTIKRYPLSHFLWNLVGISLIAQGEIIRGLKTYKRALTIEPSTSGYYFNMGNGLIKRNNSRQAIDYYRRSIIIDNNNADAHLNLGNAHRERGNYSSTIASYIQSIKINPNNKKVFHNLGLTLQKLEFEAPFLPFHEICEKLIGPNNYVQPIEVARSLLSLLKAETKIQKLLCENRTTFTEAEFIAALDILSDYPLLAKLIQIAMIPDLQLELLFREIRKFFLENIMGLQLSRKHLKFLESLALHCFTNEYVYLETDAETDLVQSLEGIICSKLKENNQPSDSQVICIACYRELAGFDWRGRLTFKEEFVELKRRLIDEPALESKLTSQIPKLGGITNAGSVQVRKQYEESPYPRWVGIGLARYDPTVRGKDNKLHTIFGEIGLKIPKSDPNKILNPEILVAGCGTGQHAIKTASRFENCEVLAIDLSLASLAYARRRTNELGLTNIRYMQADLLELNRLGCSYDIIECVGVLHHMDDPIEGWRVLADILRPNGMMKIGLYSMLARKNIQTYREIISSQEPNISPKRIKELRHKILMAEDENLKELLLHYDLYSLSTTRDLLFHVREHQFTIREIQRILQELNLEFCGFENDKLVDLFTQKYGSDSDLSDLDKWHEFEAENPNSFISMYQFWCQK